MSERSAACYGLVGLFVMIILTSNYWILSRPIGYVPTLQPDEEIINRIVQISAIDTVMIIFIGMLVHWAREDSGGNVFFVPYSLQAPHTSNDSGGGGGNNNDSSGGHGTTVARDDSGVYEMKTENVKDARQRRVSDDLAFKNEWPKEKKEKSLT